MKVWTIDLNKPLTEQFPVVVCIGYFDGMHLGHQKLVSETVDLAARERCESGLITFDPDPWVTIKDMDHVTHITTMEQRIRIAGELGIQNVFIINFTKQMSHLSPEDFENQVLGRLDLRGIVCGFDYRYGYRGEGSGETLRARMKCPIHIIDAVNDDAGKISSTRISALIAEGKVDEAARLMGRNYEVEGKVIYGRQKGRLIGFPTANIRASGEYLRPLPGVYAGYAKVLGKHYMAMINFGHNPTMNYRDDLSMEAYILDFKGEIYGDDITVQFVRYMRAEVKFASIEKLIAQLREDEKKVRSLLSES